MWETSRVWVFGRAIRWRATLLEILLKALLLNKMNIGLLLESTKLGFGNGKNFDLPRQTVDRIQAIHIQEFGEKDDSLMWKFSPNRDYSMASTYHLAIAEQPKPLPFMGCWIWSLDTLQKSNTSFGCATMAAYRWGKSLRRVASIALEIAFCAMYRKNLYYMSSEIGQQRGNSSWVWECLKPWMIFFPLIWWIGLSLTAYATAVSMPTIFLGALNFPLLCGCYGNKEIRLFLKTPLST